MQPEEVRQRLGGAVSALRRAQGWSQTELADHLGEQLGKVIDPTTITRMERGTRPTTVDELVALGAVFSVPVATLIPGSGAIETLAADFEVEAKYRESERIRLASEVQRASAFSASARIVRNAGNELLHCLRSGDLASAPGALVNIAVTMDRTGGLYLDIPLANIMLELGVSDSVIAKVRKGTKSNTKFVSRVLEIEMPKQWKAFEIEMHDLEAAAESVLSDEIET